MRGQPHAKRRPRALPVHQCPAGTDVYKRQPSGLVSPPIRLAVLASSTVDHLLPAIRVGGLRRDLWIDIHTPDYGQYTQALMDPTSELHAFQPLSLIHI